MIQAWADLLNDLVAGEIVELVNDMRPSRNRYPKVGIGAGNDEGFRVAMWSLSRLPDR